MATDRRAEVTWHGDLKGGSGTIDRVTTGAFGPLDVSWPARTEQPDRVTSPEELIAAAHASCYCMALANTLAGDGNPPTRLSASATVTFVPGTGITASALTVAGVVPDLDAPAFEAAAQTAKDGCPVSGALKGNVELSVTATLEQA